MMTQLNGAYYVSTGLNELTDHDFKPTHPIYKSNKVNNKSNMITMEY